MRVQILPHFLCKPYICRCRYPTSERFFCGIVGGWVGLACKKSHIFVRRNKKNPTIGYNSYKVPQSKVSTIHVVPRDGTTYSPCRHRHCWCLAQLVLLGLARVSWLDLHCLACASVTVRPVMHWLALHARGPGQRWGGDVAIKLDLPNKVVFTSEFWRNCEC